MAKYDVVVVGAGNAGLVAALQCLKMGKKTLVIEQHNLPGGCATSFVRGRFEIEPSLHELCDYGPDGDPGHVRTLLESFGVELDWVRIPDCYRVVSKYSDGGEMDVTMPSGIGAYIDAMERYVPGSRKKMEELFLLFQEVIDGIAYISSMKGHPDSSVLQEKYPNLLRTGAYSTKKVFDAMKLPLRCQDILSVYWAYLGVDMEHLSFIHYACMVHKYISRGAYMPEHTSHQLSQAIVERIREMGGEVWYNCRAEKFLFDKDRLSGVETNLGIIDAGYVLANINPDIIYGKMMPRELVPEREKKLSAARRGILGGRMFTAYFCLDRTAEELGIRDYSIFLPGTADSVKEYNNILKGMKYNDFSIFLCYNIANRSFSPEGTCVCSFTTFASPADWNDLEEKDYFRFKNECAAKFLKSLKDKTGIDLSGHIEEMEVASPLTFCRYLGVPEGSVYGYETRDWDGMMARTMMMGTDYPIKGLRPIGASGPRGDGYSAAMICGQMLAVRAVKDLEKMGGEN